MIDSIIVYTNRVGFKPDPICVNSYQKQIIFDAKKLNPGN